ncbi:ABC transporter substrate-binding protein [Paracoccus alkenifer]|uniref:Iron complex transport system substrate-binding protein n=1 Tax=Paracoccus alkenifer TaxID=65735 RepID=A0A1H6JRI0_9RHOB|nr:ABC transporter substrate-binding protein [Paracoccus alkenifer]SEH62487.1 iron complex transport system substrate-binding protein [Paracoccus alkenifer]
MVRHLAKAGCIALGLWLGGAADAAPPQRVVSMNLCTDQLAMLVAAPGQLVSVSYLAVDPMASAMVAQAETLPVNHGLAEEIAFLRPDLVLAGRYTTRVTVDMLTRLGHRVEIFEPENSLDDIRANLRQMGRVLGREARAEALVAQMDAELAQIAAAAPPVRPETAIYYSSGFTSGAGSLGNTIVETAGLENIAPRLGMGAGGVIPLEALILAGPRLVVRGQTYQGHSRGEEMLRHPALEAMLTPPRAQAETRPEWSCGTPLTVNAIRALQDAARAGAGL